MKADGPRLDGAATSAAPDGGGQGRAGASFVPKEGGGRAKKIIYIPVYVYAGSVFLYWVFGFWVSVIP